MPTDVFKPSWLVLPEIPDSLVRLLQASMVKVSPHCVPLDSALTMRFRAS